MSFNVAAEAYDLFMGAWSGPLSPLFADFSGIRPGMHVLDVGCGPGSLVAELVARVGTERVAAVDPSESFVAAARERYPRVDIRVASAEALPHLDGSFDATLAQLVVHFMSDPVGGLRQMARVTRPGGAVAACVWDHATDRGPLSPFWLAVGELDPGAPNESALAGAREGHLVELFRQAELRGVVGGEVSVTRRFAKFDDWWHPFTLGVGPAGGYLSRLDAARRERVRERCQAHWPEGPFDMTAVAWAARGIA
jgi:SAM-dependent methyltransferase